MVPLQSAIFAGSISSTGNPRWRPENGKCVVIDGYFKVSILYSSSSSSSSSSIVVGIAVVVVVVLVVGLVELEIHLRCNFTPRRPAPLYRVYPIPMV